MDYKNYKTGIVNTNHSISGASFKTETEHYSNSQNGKQLKEELN